MDKLVLLVEKSTAEMKKAEFQKSLKEKLIDVRRAELEMGRARLSQHSVKAPLNGQVTQVFKKVGEWVEEGEVVAKIVSLDELLIEVKVPVDLASKGVNDVEFIRAEQFVEQQNLSCPVVFRPSRGQSGEFHDEGLVYGGQQ